MYRLLQEPRRLFCYRRCTGISLPCRRVKKRLWRGFSSLTQTHSDPEDGVVVSRAAALRKSSVLVIRPPTNVMKFSFLVEKRGRENSRHCVNRVLRQNCHSPHSLGAFRRFLKRMLKLTSARLLRLGFDREGAATAHPVRRCISGRLINFFLWPSTSGPRALFRSNKPVAK